MKIVIIGFAALVIGIGGGAFVSGSKVKAQILEEAALAHADSVSDVEGVDSIAHDTDATDGSLTLDIGATPGVDDSTNAPAGVEATSDGDTTEAGAETKTTTAAIDAATAAPRFDAEGAEKLSKIFGAMKAPDAAKVLEEMSDEEIKAILQRMSDRFVARLLLSY